MITQETGVKILGGQSVKLEAVASDVRPIDDLVAGLRVAMKSQRTRSNVALRKDIWHLTLEIGKLQDGELTLIVSALSQTDLVLSELDPPQSQPNHQTPTDK